MLNTPSGMIYVYGKEQLEALQKAMNTAQDMYSAVEDKLEAETAMITVKAVTSKCFKVEVTGFVKSEEEDN